MSNYKKVDIESWARKNTYKFYKDFDDPYFNFTSNLKVSGLYKEAKENNYSFFLLTMWYCLKAANSIHNFKLRIENEDLIIYDKIDGGSTVLYDDDSFGFAYYNYTSVKRDFIEKSQLEIEKRKEEKSFIPNMDGQMSNLIYFSSIPWFSFSSTKHAQDKSINRSIPRITIGKYYELNGNLLLPMSVEANHALMDGLHLGQFFQAFETDCA